MDPGIRDNPWLHPGPGSPHAASIRELIDRPAPSGDPRSGPAAHARNAVGVAEVYRAQYRGADGSTVEVYAVRFDDQQLTLRAVALTLDPRQRPRLVRGPTAVLVFRSGDWRTMTRAGEACHDAVRDHIASMK
jgi:hypothetical protein